MQHIEFKGVKLTIIILMIFVIAIVFINHRIDTSGNIYYTKFFYKFSVAYPNPETAPAESYAVFLPLAHTLIWYIPIISISYFIHPFLKELGNFKYYKSSKLKTLGYILASTLIVVLAFLAKNTINSSVSWITVVSLNNPLVLLHMILNTSIILGAGYLSLRSKNTSRISSIALSLLVLVFAL